MGTITGQTLADQVEILLQDETNVRWTEPELLDWINAAQRETVGWNPSAKTAESVEALSAGTRQSIPSDGIQLIDVTRYMGTGGSSPGRAIRLLERKVLDEQRPDWHAETQKAEPKHYVHDARDPKAFFVYPPNDGNGQVEIIYSAAPTDLADLSDTIDVDDIYANALVDYVAYRALSKDAEYTGNGQVANSYFSRFQQFVAHRGQIDGHTVPGASQDSPRLRQSGVSNGPAQ